LELSPHTSRVPHHELFPSIELEGEIPTSYPCHSEVSATHNPHVDDEKGYEFPIEGFPYIGRVSSLTFPETSRPMLPHGYTTLAQLISGTPSASSLYRNSIWYSNSMPKSGLFILNKTSQTSC